MNYTQQFNQEFDRIYKLIFGEEWSKRSDFNTLLIFEKIRILHEIFTAKNKKGEWVLKKGTNPNPNYQKDSDFYCDTYSEAYINLDSDYFLETLRDLFLANCMPSNDPEQDKIKIENLKLIKW